MRVVIRTSFVYNTDGFHLLKVGSQGYRLHMGELSLADRLNRLGGDKFEHLCRDLLVALGFTDVDWLKGGPDEGRDLEASTQNHGLTWFFECKRYTHGIAVKDLADKVAWAEAEKADVILSNSHLTPSAKRWLTKDRKRSISIVNWTDSTFELLCYSFPEACRAHIGALAVPGPLRGRSFHDEVLAPFLIERGGFENFTSFPFSAAPLWEAAQRQVENAFAQLRERDTEGSRELCETLQRQVWASNDALESILQETAPAGADHNYMFSADVKRRLFKRFCTEEAAIAFFQRNLWADKYVGQQRRLAEKHVAANRHDEALDTLSSLWVYVNYKSEVPFKVVEGHSSSHSAYRVRRAPEDDRLIDDIMQFARSIALSHLGAGTTRIDTYEGWEIVTAAVDAVIRRAFKRYRDGETSHEQFLEEVNGAFWEVFQLSGVFSERAAHVNRMLLWNLIKGILLGISASGFIYSMWRMYTAMDPSAQEMAYREIKHNVDAQVESDINEFRRSIVSQQTDPERVYSQFYSYIFHYVFDLDAWHRHYY